jgi:hypothetical protein
MAVDLRAICAVQETRREVWVGEEWRSDEQDADLALLVAKTPGVGEQWVQKGRFFHAECLEVSAPA